MAFEALVLEKKEGSVTASVRLLEPERLPEGDVLVSVMYSSLNYKDALAVTGAGPIVRRYPLVPGVDLAGTVTHSDDARYAAGEIPRAEAVDAYNMAKERIATLGSEYRR